VLGREELDKLAVQKQALLVASSLNRLAIQAEVRNLRAATAWVRAAAVGSEQFAPWLLSLTPIAGFLLAKVSRRPDSWLSRVLAAAKWVGPLYGVWKRLSAARRQREAGQPGA